MICSNASEMANMYKAIHTDVRHYANNEVSHSEMMSTFNYLTNNKSYGQDDVNAEHLNIAVIQSCLCQLHCSNYSWCITAVDDIGT